MSLTIEAAFSVIEPLFIGEPCCVSRFSSAAFMDAETALLFKEFSLGLQPVIEIVSLSSSPCLI